VILIILSRIGIFFFPLIAMTCSFDINGGEMAPTRDFISIEPVYSIFPSMVSGPVERVIDRLPQFQAARRKPGERSMQGCGLQPAWYW
jgi:hypothetical protein